MALVYCDGKNINEFCYEYLIINMFIENLKMAAMFFLYQHYLCCQTLQTKSVIVIKFLGEDFNCSVSSHLLYCFCCIITLIITSLKFTSFIFVTEICCCLGYFV